jgi:hypothetical protein
VPCVRQAPFLFGGFTAQLLVGDPLEDPGFSQIHSFTSEYSPAAALSGAGLTSQQNQRHPRLEIYHAQFGGFAKRKFGTEDRPPPYAGGGGAQ